MPGGLYLILDAGQYCGDVIEHVVIVRASLFPVHSPLRFTILKFSLLAFFTLLKLKKKR